MAIKHPLVLYGTSIQEIRSGDAIDPSLLGTSFIITPGTGLIQDAAGLSIRSISAGDSTIGAMRYNGITVAPGQFDGSSTLPVSTNRLNYNGYFYATRFYGDGSNLTNLPININAGTGIKLTGNTISNTGVTSVNGLTGAVTLSTGSNYTAGTGISIFGTTITNSGVISVNGKTGNNITLTGSDLGIPSYSAGTGISISGTTITNTGVTSVNGQTGAVTLTAGSNYTAGTGISISGSTITNDGVTFVNGLKGSVTIRGGSNVTLTTSGNTITINSTGASGTTTYIAGTGISISGSTISNTGVTSVNGQTGAVTLPVGTTYTGGSGIGISGSTISNTGVTSVNSATGPITLQAGSNVTLTTSGNTITINSTGASGTTTYIAGTGISISGSTISNTGVTSVNSKTGAVSIQAGSNVALTTSGNTITISSTAPNYTAGTGISISGSTISNTGVTSVNGQTGAVTLTTGSNYSAGTGISISGTTITNTGVTSVNGQTGAIKLDYSAGNSNTGYVIYSGTSNNSGQWNSGTAMPTSTVRLNYNGDLYANTLQVGGGRAGTASVGLRGLNGGTVAARNVANDAYAFLTLSGTNVDIAINDSAKLQVTSTNIKVNNELAVGGHVYPTRDNSYVLGVSNLRFSSLYLATGTINTSDVRAKADIEDCNLGLDFIKKLRPVSYKFKSGSTFDKRLEDATDEEKQHGEIYEFIQPGGIDTNDTKIEMIQGSTPGKRTHYGLISQEVKETLGDRDFAGWVLTDINDPESEQGLRYDQFISPLIKAVQELSAKVEELEAKLNQQK